MDGLLTKVLGRDWRDVLTVVGFVAGLFGIWLTVYYARRAKGAAEQAREAATQVKAQLFHVDSVAYLSEAVTIMEEIQRHHRAAAWHVVLDRYVAVKKLLIIVRSGERVSDEHVDGLTTAIVQFSDISKEVERAVRDNLKTPPNAAKLNDIVATQMDKVNEIRAEVRRAGGDR